MVTELRVHGVGGTSPEGVLDQPDPERVAGDGRSGFWRPRGAPEGRQREAYAWGGLTSGTASRAAWLLLLPFTLVNVALWAGPSPRDRRLEALVRLLALSMTATMVLAAVGVGVDLMAWQCAGDAGCLERHTFLRRLGEATPGQRCVVGLALPLLLLAALVLLSRTSRDDERTRLRDGADGEGLAERDFWFGADRTRRLRLVHAAAGLAVCGLALAWPAWRWDAHHSGVPSVLGLLVVTACGGVLLGASAAVATPRIVQRTRTATRVPLVLVALSAVALAAGGVVAALPRDAWAGREATALPGFAPAVTWVFALQVLGVVVLAALRATDRSLPARGRAQAVIAGLGLLLAGVFAAGLTVRTADWLDGGATPTGAEGALVLPPAYAWSALAMVLVVALVLVPLLGVVLRHRGRAAQAWLGPVVQERPELLGLEPEEAERRVARQAEALATAELTDRAVDWLGVFVASSLVAALLAVVASALTAEVPAQAVPAALAGTVSALTQLGTLAVGAVALGLVSLGAAAYRKPALRRTVGVLWDIGTFWPRAAHPFAPPSYAERAVPDLALRVRYLSAEGVVLSAHSQGSVLAAAVLLQLREDEHAGVGLVTHGSPLERLYGRVFPTWFGPGTLQGLQGRVVWRNLWRHTDPIGGPSLTAADAPVLLDPPTLADLPGDPVPPRPRGHLDFDRTPEHERAVREVEPAALSTRVSVTLEG